jgi:rhomboid protease GluP
MNDSSSGAEPLAEFTPPPRPAPVIRENLVSPVVTYALIIISVLIYVLQFGTEALFGTDIPAALGMKVNALIIAGEYWRLLTPMFLHGSLLHIGFNMYALFIIGADLERRFGHARYLLLYVLAAFSGNVLSFLLSPDPSLGASTAIFGLLGAQMVFFYQNRKLFGSGARRALQNSLMVAGINLVIGLSPGIDNWGHVGGLLGGLVFAWFAGPMLVVIEDLYPNFRVEDTRGLRDELIGAVFVALIFGGLAAAKISGLAF